MIKIASIINYLGGCQEEFNYNLGSSLKAMREKVFRKLETRINFHRLILNSIKLHDKNSSFKPFCVQLNIKFKFILGLHKTATHTLTILSLYNGTILSLLIRESTPTMKKIIVLNVITFIILMLSLHGTFE